MSRLKLREYAEKDKSEVVDLLKKGLTEQFTEIRWDWLHHNNATFGSHIIIAEFEGKIVGTVGAIRKEFVLNEKAFSGGRHVDPVVNASMRGKGVFTKMLDALNEMCTDVSFSYTFPNAVSCPGFKKKGYTSIGPVYMPVCQLAFFNQPVKEKIRYLTTGLKILGHKDTTIEKGNFRDLENLEPIRPQNKYALLRDYSYVKWRYGDSPVKNYDFLIQRINGEVSSACVILRENRIISIMDFIEYKKRGRLKDYLAAIRRLYGKMAVVCWDSNYLDTQKYFIGKSVQNFLVKENKDKMPDDFFDKNNWYICKGEVEGN